MIACGESLPSLHIEFRSCNPSAELGAVVFREQVPSVLRTSI